MQVFLVGGAVRDKYLGLEVTEQDWVVIGATPAEMTALGYKPVGKDFPVFLHPKTKEEYALARTEKKSGHGYQGFTFNSDPGVSLKDDLLRRDLTINAMAEDSSGKLFDPYSGMQDLENKILRHVSDAFAEDPVRLLRLARFASRFHDFKVHPDTQSLMDKLVSSGEIKYLTPERVWQELTKAFSASATWRFFEVLDESGANEVLWPKLLPKNATKILKDTAAFKYDIKIRFSALCFALDIDTVKEFIRIYKVQKSVADMVLLVVKYGRQYLELKDNAEQVLDLLNKLDVWRRPERLTDFCNACGPSGKNSNICADMLIGSYHATENLSTSDLPNIKELKGADIAVALKASRLLTLGKYLASRR